MVVSFCLNENHIDNPIATNPITNNRSVTAITKSNNHPTNRNGLSFQILYGEYGLSENKKLHGVIQNLLNTEVLSR